MPKLRGNRALEALIEPVVTGLGYDLVGVEYLGRGRSGLLRVYIDLPGGVTVEDCERVSHQVSGLLDVEDPIPGSYHLEVSSPGLDRPLFKARDFARFAGRRAQLRLARPLEGRLEGRRRVTGTLRGLEEGEAGTRVRLALDEGGELSLDLEEIDSARLVPEVDFGRGPRRGPGRRRRRPGA